MHSPNRNSPTGSAEEPETHIPDLARQEPEILGARRPSLEGFLGARDPEWERTRALTEGRPTQSHMTEEACEKLLALAYTAPRRCPIRGIIRILGERGV